MENGNPEADLESRLDVQCRANYFVITALLAYLDAMEPGVSEILASALESLSDQRERTDLDRAAFELAIKRLRAPAPQLRLVPKG